MIVRQKTLDVHTVEGSTEELRRQLQHIVAPDDQVYYTSEDGIKLKITKLQEYGRPKDDIYAWKQLGGQWHHGSIYTITEYLDIVG